MFAFTCAQVKKAMEFIYFAQMMKEYATKWANIFIKQ
jgi:hypothetical protein